jgi:phospholipase C
MTDPASRIKHVVVMMFENRSFDSMLGFLYKDNKNKSSLGHTFEGLTGHETNPDSNGNAIQVFQIDPDDPNAYFMPNKDPGEGFGNTNFQLFGAASAPYPKGIANNQGFVRDFEDPLNNAPFEREEHPCTKSTTHKDSSIQRMIIKVMLIKNGIKNRVHLDILQMFPS